MRQNSLHNSILSSPRPQAPAAVAPVVSSAPATEHKDQNYYTIPEIAERLRCSETQVRRLLATHKVKVLDMGEGARGKKVVRKSELTKMENKLHHPMGA